MTRHIQRTSGQPASTISQPSQSEPAIADFAQDLGHLLGQAQKKDESWLTQRKAIIDHLTDVRDTARRLLEQLGVTEMPVTDRRVERESLEGAKRAGAPRMKRRTLSAEAREKIAAAQRARWAKQKRQSRE